MLLKPFYGFASQEFQLIGFLCLLLLLEANNTNNIRAKRYDYRELTHEPKPLSTEQIRFLASPQLDQSELFESTLDAILIPRSPGSDGHKKVQKFIYDTLHALQWTVSADQFQTGTPLGKRHFANIVATLHPNHCRRLVLACHYDSKLNREKTFLGATDSAVPCAMLLHVATLLDKYLKNSTSSGDLTLQLVFFDGEEALVTWSNEDSLYGSRHLANKWSRAPFPRDLRSTCNKTATDRELDRVELLMLLDLIGARSPKFYSQFPNTRPLFARLVTIESELNELGLLERKANGKQSQYFSPRQSFSYIEDDHVPFLRRNVPVLHVIATPFPSVWHREEDNRENLDFATIRNLVKIVRVFVAEYLHLTVN